MIVTTVNLKCDGCQRWFDLDGHFGISPARLRYKARTAGWTRTKTTRTERPKD